MKKIYLTLLALVMTLAVANAQFTKLGGGLGFTTGYIFHNMDYDYNKSGNLNIFAKGIYELSLPIHFSPSITYMPHLYKDPAGEFKTFISTLMFDINGHYVFNSLDRMEFYGLAGIDVLLAFKKDVSSIAGAADEVFKEKDNAFGLNIGAGSYIKLTEQMDLSVEAKYLLSKIGYRQFMINAGVLLNLQWLNKNENQEY